jgi:hypothetical protein
MRRQQLSEAQITALRSLPCRAGPQLSYRMIDPVFINMDYAAAGRVVPAVSLRAEAGPADEFARVVHFFGMAAIAAFLVIHILCATEDCRSRR